MNKAGDQHSKGRNGGGRTYVLADDGATDVNETRERKNDLAGCEK
jgi:hypothetical protein